MSGRRLSFIIIGVVVAVAVVIAVTLALTPQQTNPAYAAAVAFAQAAGQGDDANAETYLSSKLREYVTAQCPEGQVSLCIESYIPPEWGNFQTVVFRRAAPDAATMANGTPTAYDVELIATYSEGLGFSGVCIYQRMEQDETGGWQVTRYGGFISCGELGVTKYGIEPGHAEPRAMRYTLAFHPG